MGHKQDLSEDEKIKIFKTLFLGNTSPEILKMLCRDHWTIKKYIEVISVQRQCDIKGKQENSVMSHFMTLMNGN